MIQELAESFRPYICRTTMAFEFHLSQIVKLGSPALKALTCLEANEATAADVFIFWHAFLAATKEVLFDSKNEFPTEVQDRVQTILSKRHRQVFGGGNLSNTIYLAAAYLDPCKYFNISIIETALLNKIVIAYLKSDLFKAETLLTGQDFDIGYTGI